MFESLGDRLQNALHKIKGYGKITEDNISDMMREIRLALLEADVNYQVVKEFTNTVKEKALGEEVQKSIKPGDLFVKIVKDELTELLGGESAPLNMSGNPAILMLVGLQGSGKTTTIGKLANFLRKKHSKKPLLVACDVYRPAAIDQLKQLGKQLGIEVYEEGKKDPVEISKNAIIYAKENNYDYVLIDTAGLRKKGKIYESVEKYSLLRSMKAIDRSDVCILVINAEEGIIEHDKHIASYALEKGKGLIIVVNKWDTVTDKNTNEYLKLIRSEFQFISYVPVVFTSALTKKRIHTIMPEILKVSENIKREIKTSILNDVISEAYITNLPPTYKGRRLKIYFVNQSGTKPPKFTFHVNSKGLVHFSYERYLENKLRENFDFEGTPIIIQFKNRGEE